MSGSKEEPQSCSDISEDKDDLLNLGSDDCRENNALLETLMDESLTNCDSSVRRSDDIPKGCMPTD